MAEAEVKAAELKKEATKKAPEAKEKPEGVDLKDIAKQLKIEPRAARAILRKLNIRGEDKKRSRWIFNPKEVPGVVAKIRGVIQEKAKAKEGAKVEEKS